MIIATDGGVKWTAEAFAMNTKKGKTMTDYIKREDALDSLRDGMCGTGYQGMAMDCLNEIYVPSADVAPVRHGRWIYEGNELVCSRCGGPVSFSRNNDGLALSGKAWALGIYCQTCGAKMDEEADK